MLRTIQIGSCMSVQGIFEGHASDGRIVVRDGGRLYEGPPVATMPIKLGVSMPKVAAQDAVLQ